MYKKCLPNLTYRRFLIYISIYTIILIFWLKKPHLIKPISNLVPSLNSSEMNCPKPYSNCNLGKAGHINVHIIAHTHNDVGWVKSLNEYYYEKVRKIIGNKINIFLRI